MADAAADRYRLDHHLNILRAQAAIALQQSSALLREILQSSLPKSGLGQVFGQQLWNIFDRIVDEPLALLPLITCEASGREPGREIPLLAAWRSMRLSAKLLDDVEDGESIYGPAEAVDLATGLLFLTPKLLRELLGKRVAADRVDRITQSLFEAGLQALPANGLNCPPPAISAPRIG